LAYAHLASSATTMHHHLDHGSAGSLLRILAVSRYRIPQPARNQARQQQEQKRGKANEENRRRRYHDTEQEEVGTCDHARVGEYPLPRRHG
jgi:hypothetical protein